jgi:pimeloyl-ACP methyl ester carboxylesterase
MLDGQNVFGDEGSFAGGWHADLAVDGFAAGETSQTRGDKLEPAIGAPVILAVDHGGTERIAELGAPSSPKLATLIDLIVDRMLPAARAHAQLREGPPSAYVAGSSMGGLAALYMHFRRPEVFGGALAMSPSLWFERRAIFGFVEAQPTPHPSRVYLDAGAREGAGRLAVLTDAMADLLVKRGYSRSAKPSSDLRVLSLVDPHGMHTEKTWRRRLPKALRFIFGP